MPTYQGSNSPAGSALGSLLRKIEEEKQMGPHRIPQTSQAASPIRAQIQAPLTAPESVGSNKVVSMKPEMGIGANIVTPPGDVVAPFTSSGVANPLAARPNSVTTPSVNSNISTSIPSQPSGPSPASQPTQQGRSVPAQAPSPSLMPSSIKSIIPSGYITGPSQLIKRASAEQVSGPRAPQNSGVPAYTFSKVISGPQWNILNGTPNLKLSLQSGLAQLLAPQSKLRQSLKGFIHW